MGNIYCCDLKVLGSVEAREVVYKTLGELGMYGEHRTYRLKDGLISHFAIKNGISPYLFERDDENNLLELSRKYEFDFEIFCDNNEDSEYQYFLVRKGKIIEEKVIEYNENMEVIFNI